jgi:hypothetical protein
MSFQPQDADFQQRGRSSFARQRTMQTPGIEIARLEPGEIDLTMRSESGQAAVDVLGRCREPIFRLS